MSEAVATTNPTPKAVAEPGAAPVDAKPVVKSLDEISGAEARILVEKAKAEGKTIQEILDAQAGGKPEAKAEAGKTDVKEAAKEAARRHKVKVDGKELEVDEQELIRGYAHQKAANKKLQEGLAARKQAEEFIAMMRDEGRLMEVIQKLGHDPRKLSEKYLAAQLEDEVMDPRDKELRDAKAKLKRIEDMERRQFEELQARRDEEVKRTLMKDYEEKFTAALQESQLPPTKPMVAEMSKYISRAAKIGFKMTPSEAAQLVKQDIMTAHQRLIGDADGEILIKLLGDNVANKIRSFDTSRLKNPESVLQTPKHQAPIDRTKRAPANKRMSAQEWRDFNRKK